MATLQSLSFCVDRFRPVSPKPLVVRRLRPNDGGVDAVAVAGADVRGLQRRHQRDADGPGLSLDYIELLNFKSCRIY